MRYNTSLDFIQPSGGNIIKAHRLGFDPQGIGIKPAGSDPNLPSGSLWVRPNLGQAERLEYQGRENSFQARTAEGIACYFAGIGPLGLTPASPITTVFRLTLIEDSRFFSKSTDGTTITCPVSGLYRISYGINTVQFMGSAGSIHIGIQTPFGTVDSGGDIHTSAIIPSPGDGGEATLAGSHVIRLSAGFDISMSMWNDGGAFAGLAITEASVLMFEFIRPLDLGDGSVQVD